MAVTKLSTRFEPGKKKRIHVNQAVIRTNNSNEQREPVITVKCGTRNAYAHSVEINGPSTVMYSPDKPLSCGAKVWIETTAEVVTIGETNEPS